MTKEEYNKAIERIEATEKEAKRKLAMDYAFANKRYKVGDIIKGSGCTILVDNIKWVFGFIKPECVYYGAALRKDLKPRKDESRDSIYDSNVEKKLN